MQITNKKAAELIKNYDDNKIFSVKFIKRTDGAVRTMQCRKGVGKFVSGGGRKVDPKHNLVVVFDIEAYNEGIRAATTTKMGCGGRSYSTSPTEAEALEIGKKCYRSINLEHIMEIRMDGLLYQVNDFPIITWIFTRGPTQYRINARTEEEARTTLKRNLNATRLPVFKVTNE